MERLDQGYLHPNLVVPVLKYPGRESNQGHPRWEASTLERNHSNSLLTAICLHPRQDIFYIYITGTGIYVNNAYFLHNKNLKTNVSRSSYALQQAGKKSPEYQHLAGWTPTDVMNDLPPCHANFRRKYRTLNKWNSSFMFPPHGRGDDAAAETSDGRRQPAWTSRRRWWQRACRCP